MEQHDSRSTHRHEISIPSHSWSLDMLLRKLKAIELKRDDKLASVLDAVGEFGTFQWRLVALTLIPYGLLSFFMFSDSFVLTAQKPYCNTSWILKVGPNLSVAEQMNLTLPRAPDGSFQTCLMYIPVLWDLDSIIHFGLNYTETCRYGWIYPYAEKRSLINEFDLVCGNEPNKENMLTVFLAGFLTGSLFFGFLCDNPGISGLRHQQFVFSHGVAGGRAPGPCDHPAALLPWIRDHSPVRSCHQDFPLEARVLAGWRTLVSHHLQYLLQPPAKKVKKVSILDFHTNQYHFKVVLTMACVWFSISYSFFTLNLKLKDCGIETYLIQIIPGILGVSARLYCIVLLENLGRKCTLFLNLILATISCFFLLFLTQELKSMVILMLVLGHFNMAASITVFFIYTCELLPTALRSTGLGMVALAFSAGAVTALAIFHNIKTQLPVFFCCLSCVLALCFSSFMPERGNQPFRDSMEYSSSIHRESIDSKRKSQDVTAMMLSEESMSDIWVDDVAKNTILNTLPLKSEASGFSNTDLKEPSNGEEPSPDP
ncbi:solute carrier family 22 member 14 isoform X3 [Alexandromys fortis]|uniref:solute carrier family 22 member 14 isoform X3 n=1 Tax=Alexandromys fortis TaxID=100897 RepID=UPI002152F360|nr:solute carrier family 22 member 14 isoform X3 [Microtus fortis]